MDYEKKYKEALERARQFSEKPYLEDSKGIVDYIFPELKESEDEQHRKWILEYLYDGLRKSDEQFKDQFKCAIAWFEKQGEQKPTNTVEPRFKINDKVIHKETGKTWTIHWYLADTNSYYVIDEEELINHYSEDVLESAEQKPAEWSEEDERKIKAIVSVIESTDERIMVSLGQNRKALCDWLKFLRPQPQWRPSGEQMNGLKEAIEFLGCTKTRRKQLQSLYEQLKKLREE